MKVTTAILAPRQLEQHGFMLEIKTQPDRELVPMIIHELTVIGREEFTVKRNLHSFWTVEVKPLFEFFEFFETREVPAVEHHYNVRVRFSFDAHVI
jgi:hypothetical protein